MNNQPQTYHRPIRFCQAENRPYMVPLDKSGMYRRDGTPIAYNPDSENWPIIGWTTCLFDWQQDRVRADVSALPRKPGTYDGHCPNCGRPNRIHVRRHKAAGLKYLRFQFNSCRSCGLMFIGKLKDGW